MAAKSPSKNPTTEREGYSRLLALLDRIELRNFPIPISISATPWGLRIDMHVPERDTGRSTVMSHRTGDTSLWPEREDLNLGEPEMLAMVRRKLLEALGHEIDECLHLDGKRIRDPHPVPRGR